MDNCHLLYLLTTAARWGGQEVQVLVSVLMEDSTGITTSAEPPMLTI